MPVSSAGAAPAGAPTTGDGNRSASGTRPPGAMTPESGKTTGALGRDATSASQDGSTTAAGPQPVGVTENGSLGQPASDVAGPTAVENATQLGAWASPDGRGTPSQPSGTPDNATRAVSTSGATTHQPVGVVAAEATARDLGALPTSQPVAADATPPRIQEPAATPSRDQVTDPTAPADPVGTTFAGRFGPRPPVRLDRSGLSRRVDEVADAPRGRDQQERPELDPGQCVDLLSALQGKIYDRPSGTAAAATTIDDSAIGTASARDRLAPGADWTRVDSWWEIERAVRAAGPGSTALVLRQQQRGVGHAFALHHTTDAEEPLQWIEPQNPPGQRLMDFGRNWQELRRHLGPAGSVRVVVLDAQGREIREGGAAPRPTMESASTAQALIDAPTDRRYGRTGFEVEVHGGFLDGSDDVDFDLVDSLARHADDGVEVALDRGRFVASDQPPGFEQYQPFVEQRGEMQVSRILEFVTSPINQIPGEQGGDPRGPALDRIRKSLNRLEYLSTAVRRGERDAIPITELFRPNDGWIIAAEAMQLTYTPVPPGDLPDLYVHHTVGVPVAALRSFIEQLGDRTWLNENLGVGARENAVSAIEFADAVSASLLPGTTPLTDGDRRDLEGFLALVYTQIAAVALTTGVG
ncbi:hypothetical protein D2L64_23880, partial [Micromonospora radicis]